MPRSQVVARIALIGYLLGGTAACAPLGSGLQTYSWKEEVKLSNGQSVWVEVTHRIESDIPILKNATLEIASERGEKIMLETSATPIALDFIDGAWVAVAAIEFPAARRELGFLDHRGYAGWRWNGSRWSRIEFEDVPKSVSSNLVYDPVEAAKRSPIAVQQKRGELHVYSYGWSCSELWKPKGDAKKCMTKSKTEGETK
jgi:hypothetical protein